MVPNIFVKTVFKTLTFLGKPKMKWELKKKYPSVFFLPHMSMKEFSLFKRMCKDANVVLEFGSGGSTIFLLEKEKKVFSVESNHEFYDYMSSIDLIKKSLGKSLQYRYIDLGATNKWGKPLSEDESSHFPEYYSMVWDDIDPSANKVDLVFIDGRFRICCCLYTILKLVEYHWDDTLIVIHDFWRRRKYHVVLEFLEEVESAADLAVFKVRKDVNLDKVRGMIEEYSLVA